MKKLFAVMAFVLTCQLSYSQTYDEIMTVFKIKPNVEYQELDKALLGLATAGTPDPKTADLMKRLDALKMMEMTLTPNDATVFNTLVGEMGTFYEKLAEQEEEGEKTTVFYEGDDEENISALIAVQMQAPADDGTVKGTMIVLEGKLSKADIEAMQSMQGED
jgi:hypothetical protein